MSQNHDTSIAGGWLGTYYYRGSQSWQSPERFEATFVYEELEGRFKGTILDDGVLGEADVKGTQTGRVLSFVKVYRAAPQQPGYTTAPVTYEGTLSEDGQQITGIWHLPTHRFGASRSRTHGVWEAHRLWSAAGEEQIEDSEEDFRLSEPMLTPAGR